MWYDAVRELAPLNWITAKKKEKYIWTAPISQTTLSQTNTFNGKCVVLALCSSAVDFAAQWHSRSTVVCNIGWEQIIWKASNALRLCKLYEILTKLIYSLFFPREHTVLQLIHCKPTIIPQINSKKCRNIFDLGKPGNRCNYSLRYIILYFMLIRSVPVNAALLVEVAATEPQASLNTALYLTASVLAGTRYYNIMGAQQQYSIWSEGRFMSYLLKIFLKDRNDTLFSKVISRGLKAEQKGRVHWEQKELHSKHVTGKWGPQSKIENHLKGFYRLQI